MNEVTQDENLIELTAEVVSAYVANNPVSKDDLLNLIASTHGALAKLTGTDSEEDIAPQDPAVPVKRSVTADYIVCLEDGKKFKSLKRHLRTSYDLTPQEYRAKWGLPLDYPMVAPNYAAARSVLAKASGLGQVRRETITPTVVEPAPVEQKAPTSRKRAPRSTSD